MQGKRFKAEILLSKLRQAGVEYARSSTVAAIHNLIRIMDATDLRSLIDFGGP
jgi:hypothetical protein